jgi:hypothetical protein
MGFLPGSLRNRRQGSKCASSLAVSVGVTALFAFAHPTNAQTYSYSFPSYYAGAGYRSLPTYYVGSLPYYNPNLYYYRSYYPYPLPRPRRCNYHC